MPSKKPKLHSNGRDAEIAELRAQLAEARETLEAIRSGTVDGLVVTGPEGEHVFSLEGAEKPYRSLVEAINEGALLLRDDGNILYANERFAQMTSKPLEEIVGTHWRRFFAPSEHAQVAEILSGVTVRAARGEFALVAKSGAEYPVQISISTIQDSASHTLAVIVTDLTERKQVETKLQQLSRLYATLSQINQAILRIHSREELGREVSRVTVDFGGFKLAWVGQHDLQAQEIIALGCSGEPQSYLRSFRHSSDQGSRRYCLCGRVVRENCYHVANDLSALQHMPDAQNGMQQAGIRSAAVFPIYFKGTIFGVFGVYAGEPGVFKEKEIALLEEAAQNISFALDHLAQEDWRLEAEAALQRANDTLEKRVEERTAALSASEERFRQMASAISEVFWITTVAWDRVLYVSPAIERIWGRSVEAITGNPTLWQEAIVAADYPQVEAAFARLTQGEPFESEYRVLRPDGTMRWVSDRGYPIFDAEGRVTMLAGVASDVTVRRQMQIQLDAKQEEYFRAIFHGASDGILLADIKTRKFVRANASICKMLGYTSEEITTLGVEDIHPAEDRGWILNEFGRMIHGGDISSLLDVPLQRKDGSVFHASLGTAIINHENTLCIAGFFRDITNRLRSEAALRESEERYRTLVEFMPIAVALADTTGRVITANPAAARLQGFERAEDLSGLHLFDFLVPNKRAELGCKIENILRDGHVESFECQILRKDGSTKPAELFGVGIKNDQNQIVGIIALAHDLTELKNAQRSVIESEERYRMLVENLPLGVIFFDHSYKIVTANKAAATLIKATCVEELMGRSAFDFIPRTSEYPATLTRVAELEQQGTIPPAEGEFLCVDGSRVPVETRAVQLQSADGNVIGFLGIAEDITRRRYLEKQQQALETKLRQQQKLESIGTLASGVAHEINNPVNGIMNYAQIIEDSLPPESPLMVYTAEIARETRRVATIVRNLLTFSRNEKQAHSPARIADIINDTLSLISTVIRHDNIKIVVNVASDLPPLRCRSQQIQQVFMNLMTNARDALNERYAGADPDKKVKVDAVNFEKEGRRWIRVTVEDHGTGIRPEVRERMFDPFFTTKSRDKGTGLGLSISHGIVRDHHGELTVESEPGKFTRMCVDLPVDNGWEIQNYGTHIDCR